jgi:hypothetical protein
MAGSGSFSSGRASSGGADRHAERVGDDAVGLIVLLGTGEPDPRQSVASEEAADAVDE